MVLSINIYNTTLPESAKLYSAFKTQCYQTLSCSHIPQTVPQQSLINLCALFVKLLTPYHPQTSSVSTLMLLCSSRVKYHSGIPKFTSLAGPSNESRNKYDTNG